MGRRGGSSWGPCISVSKALSVALLPLVGEGGRWGESPLSAIQWFSPHTVCAVCFKLEMRLLEGELEVAVL